MPNTCVTRGGFSLMAGLQLLIVGICILFLFATATTGFLSHLIDDDVHVSENDAGNDICSMVCSISVAGLTLLFFFLAQVFIGFIFFMGQDELNREQSYSREYLVCRVVKFLVWPLMFVLMLPPINFSFSEALLFSIGISVLMSDLGKFFKLYGLQKPDGRKRTAAALAMALPLPVLIASYFIWHTDPGNFSDLSAGHVSLSYALFDLVIPLIYVIAQLLFLNATIDTILYLSPDERPRWVPVFFYPPPQPVYYPVHHDLVHHDPVHHDYAHKQLQRMNQRPDAEPFHDRYREAIFCIDEEEK